MEPAAAKSASPPVAKPVPSPSPVVPPTTRAVLDGGPTTSPGCRETPKEAAGSSRERAAAGSWTARDLARARWRGPGARSIGPRRSRPRTARRRARATTVWWARARPMRCIRPRALRRRTVLLHTRPATPRTGERGCLRGARRRANASIGGTPKRARRSRLRRREAQRRRAIGRARPAMGCAGGRAARAPRGGPGAPRVTEHQTSSRPRIGPLHRGRGERAERDSRLARPRAHGRRGLSDARWPLADRGRRPRRGGRERGHRAFACAPARHHASAVAAAPRPPHPATPPPPPPITPQVPEAEARVRASSDHPLPNQSLPELSASPAPRRTMPQLHPSVLPPIGPPPPPPASAAPTQAAAGAHATTPTRHAAQVSACVAQHGRQQDAEPAPRRR